MLFAASTKGSLWVDIVLASSQDPGRLAARNADGLLEQIWQYTTHQSKSFVDAAYRSVATLAFVAPTQFLPSFCNRIAQALDPAALSFIGDTELGIFSTPAGIPYIDGKYDFESFSLSNMMALPVLAKRSKGPAFSTKGKNADLEKWDEETRTALAAKKKTPSDISKLSKADQLLVDTQIRLEANVRHRISAALAMVLQGLGTIQSLLTVRIEALSTYVPRMLSALLDVVTSSGCLLYAEDAFQTFLVSC